MSDATPAEDTAGDEAIEEVAPEPEVPKRYGVPVTTWRDQDSLHPTRDEVVALVKTLRADGYWMCVDLCGVDYLTHPGRSLPYGVTPERFEVVINLLDMTARRRLRLRVQVPESDPTCPSVTSVHPGAEAMEREAFDMFGIEFTGHPDLSRILMPEEWVGHPLRKDYAIGKIPVQFKGAPT